MIRGCAATDADEGAAAIIAMTGQPLAGALDGSEVLGRLAPGKKKALHPWQARAECREERRHARRNLRHMLVDERGHTGRLAKCRGDSVRHLLGRKGSDVDIVAAIGQGYA